MQFKALILSILTLATGHTIASKKAPLVRYPECAIMDWVRH